jgi:hypothetical protein
MRDVEVLLRYFGFQFAISEYTGNLKRFLDETASLLNEQWSNKEGQIKAIGESCEDSIDATFKVFGDNAFYRWASGKYEGRFNRAVFDVMTYYFSDESIRTKAVAHASQVEAAFRDLCDSNQRFVESIQTTTKTPLATHRRLSLWGEALSQAIDVRLDIPELRDNRLVL